jgi:hypothetical protein
MKAYKGVEVQLQSFFTSALVGGRWSALPLGHISSRGRSSVEDCVGGLVGLRKGLDVSDKRKIHCSCRESSYVDGRRYCGIIIDCSELACTTADGEHLDSGARVNTKIRFCIEKFINYTRRGFFFRSCVSTVAGKNQEA